MAALLLAALLFTGCATQRPVIALPYAMPTLGAGDRPTTTLPSADIATVADSRVDRSLDMFLNEPPADFLRKALSAELVAGGAFAHVATTADPQHPTAIAIEAELKELSWAVPNHDGIVKTAFWTSFLTGGLGGVAYGSTGTPVFGHAVVALKITERETHRVVLDQTFDAVHEERTAKLKCDTLDTRSRVMAAALKAVLQKAVQAAKPPVATPASS